MTELLWEISVEFRHCQRLAVGWPILWNYVYEAIWWSHNVCYLLLYSMLKMISFSMIVFFYIFSNFNLDLINLFNRQITYKLTHMPLTVKMVDLHWLFISIRFWIFLLNIYTKNKQTLKKTIIIWIKWKKITIIHQFEMNRKNIILKFILIIKWMSGSFVSSNQQISILKLT